MGTYFLWASYAALLFTAGAMCGKFLVFASDKAQKLDEVRLKPRFTRNKLALAGARVSLVVAYGIYDGKEIVQLINPHGKVVFQRIDDGSEDFWEKTYNDGCLVIQEALDRMWPKK